MKRIFALIVAGALCCGLLSTVFAEGDEENALQTEAVYEAPASSQEAGASSSGETDEAPETPDVPEPEPDPEGSLSFENLERRIRENNITMHSLDANLASIDVVDFDRMKEDLRVSLNQIASAQWQMTLSTPSLPTINNTGDPGIDGMIIGVNSSMKIAEAALSASTSMAVKSMQTQYDALRETFDGLKDGTVQADYAAARRQIENAQDQFVAGAESLYTAMLEMRVQRRGLQQQLDALDRTIEEMELRYSLGQISALQLQEVKSGRASLASGIATLDMNIRNYTLQMETWVGAEQTGTLVLYELPVVTDKQIAEMDLERDLATAKEISYTLFAAKRTLEDAEEDLYENHHGQPSYMIDSARQTYKAAEYTYDAAVQNFELNFRTVFAAVADCKQILTAKETALALKRANFEAQELKYQQGTISENQYLSAKDELNAAGNDVTSAKHDLFAAYRTYYWAITFGLLN